MNLMKFLSNITFLSIFLSIYYRITETSRVYGPSVYEISTGRQKNFSNRGLAGSQE